MRNVSLSSTVNLRVPIEMKADLERAAERRHLDLADICREAFRKYIAEHEPMENVHSQRDAEIVTTSKGD